MGADNWGICPRCYATHQEKIKQAEVDLEMSYGNVGREAHIKLDEEFVKLKAKSLTPTLREDWELGIANDWLTESGQTDEDVFEFMIGYGCYCNICKFSYKFRHREEVK